MTDHMPRPRPPYVRRETTRHGKVVWYFRRPGGVRVRLPAPYTPGFDKAYADALAGVSAPDAVSKPVRGTVSWLIDRYMETAVFNAFEDTTKAMRRQTLERIRKACGNDYLSQIDTGTVQGTIDGLKPFAAHNFRKTARAMFKWAKAAGHVSENPTDETILPITKSDGFHSWTPDEVKAYEARHPIGTMARLAMDLLLYTNLRRADVVKLGRQHIKDDWLTYRANKNRAWIERPIMSPLAHSIGQTELSGLTFITNAKGEPFSPAAFGNWFRDRCIEAGVPGRAHGLRKAGAALAAERGATAPQLMATFGWKSISMAAHYIKAADRKRLAKEMSLLMEGNAK